MLRIISLNLNGIRSAWSKNLLPWLCQQEASIVCLQELKAQLPDLSPEMLSPDGLHAHYHAAEKKGYSGVGIWARQAPDHVSAGFGVPEFDAEGRYLRADFANLSVISLYLPSGSASPERQAPNSASWRHSCPIWQRYAPRAGKSSSAATGISPTMKST